MSPRTARSWVAAAMILGALVSTAWPTETHSQGQPQRGLAADVAALQSSVATLQSSVNALQSAVAGLQGTTACLNIPTVTVHVPLMARGSYSVTGAHLPSNSLVGRPMFQGSVLGAYRNYFVFDLGVLGELDLILGAQLITANPPGGFQGDGTDTLTLVLNRVSRAPSSLMNGTAGGAGYVDLADGPVYGSYIASAATNGTQIIIELSHKAIRDMYRSRHNGFGNDFEPYLFAIGGSIADLGTTSGNAVFLALGQNFPLTNTALELNVRHYTTFCPPPFESQYQ